MNFRKKILSAAIIIASLSVVAISCKKKPNDDVPFSFNLDIYKAPALIEIKNADTSSTGVNIKTLPDVPVTILGKDSALVVNGEGGTTFKLSKGFLQLALLSSANPSSSNPISFTLKADIPGFATVLQSITITDTLARSYSFAAYPAISASVSTTAPGDITGGTVAKDLQIVVKATDPTLGSQISIPLGTQVEDKDGKLVSASKIISKVVQYGSAKTPTLGAFPGGLQVGTAINAQGQVIHGGNFVTGGLMQINMTNENGTAIKKFSKPVALSMDLDPSLGNFEKNGDPIVAGDSIPLWSMDETTGIWKAEGKAGVVNDNGKLKAKFSITHLSCWNLDWMWYPGYFGLPNLNSCSSSLNVTITSNDPNFNGYYDVTIVDKNNNYLGAAHGEYIYNGYVLTFPYLPQIKDCKVQVSRYMGSRVLGETVVSNPCSAGNVTVNVTTPPPPQPVNVVFDLTGKCTNKNITAYFSTWLFIYNTDSGEWTWYYLSGSEGSLTIKNLQLGVNYQLWANYNGGWNVRSFVLDTKDHLNFGVPAGSNDTYTVSSIYDAATNTVNIKGNIGIQCN